MSDGQSQVKGLDGSSGASEQSVRTVRFKTGSSQPGHSMRL